LRRNGVRNIATKIKTVKTNDYNTGMNLETKSNILLSMWNLKDG
jgi:hypothetical protein